MNKAIFVKEITVIDPDTKGEVQIAIYKHQAGGMFGIDASFLLEFEDKITIPDVFSNPTRKVLLLEGEENPGTPPAPENTGNFSEQIEC